MHVKLFLKSPNYWAVVYHHYQHQYSCLKLSIQLYDYYKKHCEPLKHCNCCTQQMITSDVGVSIPSVGHVTKVKEKTRFLPADIYHIFI